MMPESPNGYKLEQFIFDYFPLADEMTVLVMDRMEEFAPVKNKTGEDSPETARRQVLDVHKRWRQALGWTQEIGPTTSWKFHRWILMPERAWSLPPNEQKAAYSLGISRLFESLLIRIRLCGCQTCAGIYIIV